MENGKGQGTYDNNQNCYKYLSMSCRCIFLMYFEEGSNIQRNRRRFCKKWACLTRYVIFPCNISWWFTCVLLLELLYLCSFWYLVNISSVTFSAHSPRLTSNPENLGATCRNEMLNFYTCSLNWTEINDWLFKCRRSAKQAQISNANLFLKQGVVANITVVQ